jgi:hypothetical protein
MYETGYHLHDRDFAYRRQARRNEAEQFRMLRAARSEDQGDAPSLGHFVGSMTERARSWLAPAPTPREQCC